MKTDSITVRVVYTSSVLPDHDSSVTERQGVMETRLSISPVLSDDNYFL